MKLGFYISGVIHVGIFIVMVFTFDMSSPPAPINVTAVSVVSGADLDELIKQTQPSVTPQLKQPVVVQTPQDAPLEIPQIDRPDDRQKQSPQSPDRQQDALPNPPDTPPSSGVREALPPANVTRPPSRPRVVSPPLPPVRPKRRPAPQTPPEDVAQTPPEIDAQQPPPEPQPPDEVLKKPDESPRPIKRPDDISDISPPPVAGTQEQKPQPSQSAQDAPADDAPDNANTADDAINQALADALSGIGEQDTITGPPFSPAEQKALRLAIGRCWNVGASSTDVLKTIVTVGVKMSKDGRPIPDSIRLIDDQGGTPQSVEIAYQKARQAILICGARGFSLPQDKYESWRDIEITFNPQEMGLR